MLMIIVCPLEAYKKSAVSNVCIVLIQSLINTPKIIQASLKNGKHDTKLFVLLNITIKIRSMWCEYIIH